MLCHDTNQATKSSGHLDVIMGSSTGDMIWFEAYTQKYFRINKNVRLLLRNTLNSVLNELGHYQSYGCL